jgi:FolB domain-containing protein
MAAEDRPLDRIHIRGLTTRCIIGINDEERVKQQDIVVGITLEADLSDACRTDSIADTVDYKDIKQRVMAMVEDSSFFLVERLAQAIADLCLQDPRIQRVHVSLDKPGALRFAKSVAVEITR